MFQLIGISNSYLIVFLDYFQGLWKLLASYAHKNVLIEIPSPSPLLLWVIFFGALFLIHYQDELSQLRKCIRLVSFIMASCILLKIFGISHIGCLHFDKPQLSVVKTQHALIAIDRGTHGCSKISSWMNYTLLPELRKKYGTSSLDALVLLKPSAACYELAHALFMHEKQRTIIMPQLTYLPPATARSFKKLTDWAKQNDHKVIYVKPDELFSLYGCSIKADGILCQTSRFKHPAISVETPSETIKPYQTIRQSLRALNTKD